MQDDNQTPTDQANGSDAGNDQQPPAPPSVMSDNMPMPDPLANFTPNPNENPQPDAGSPANNDTSSDTPSIGSISSPASSDDKPAEEDKPEEMTLPAPTDDSKSEPGLDEPTDDDSNSTAPTDDNKLEDTLSSYVAEPVKTDASSGDLDGIKQEAVKELAPLVDKLDQPAEERFRTLLSIIRATDDSKYLDAALKAAKEITDETKRAEALLDVINEVNYLSRQQDEAA